ncbi:MAG: hypothetical protein U9N52_04055 [Campylobacterota bacterium]|nr:hypothetical protein [Campylobacterota bacterium]
MTFLYKEHIIEVQEGMQFHCTTDGYLDQNGGEKSFPFGKKRFNKNVILENYTKTMTQQKEIYLDTLHKYQADEERNDDATFVGFKI